jgi:hypothetical protein
LKGVGFWIFEVVRYPVVKLMAVMKMMTDNEPVKIVEDKEPRKEEPGAPERISNPGI